MEEFCENLVVIRKNAGKTMLMFLVWIAAFLIIGISVMFIAVLQAASFIISLGAIAGAVYISKFFSIEYETIITNGDIDIDSIISRSSRKRVLSFKCADIEGVKKFNPNEKSADDGKKRYMFCNRDDSDAYVLTVNHKSKGTVYITMVVNAKMKAQMKPFCDALVLRELVKENQNGDNN